MRKYFDVGMYETVAVSTAYESDRVYHFTTFYVVLFGILFALKVPSIWGQK